MKEIEKLSKQLLSAPTTKDGEFVHAKDRKAQARKDKLERHYSGA